MGNKLSPMMKQYLEKKAEYPDCLLFYRLGDFYEMFFEDAKTVSNELNLVLTGRDCGLDERAPMCGIPHHALNTYLPKLLEKNYKVAVCEQLTAPEKGKMVERDVVRVVTKATNYDDSLLDASTNNFVAVFIQIADDASLIWADATTGEMFASKFKDNYDNDLNSLLLKIKPTECFTNSVSKTNTLPSVKAGDVPEFSTMINFDINKNHTAPDNISLPYNSQSLHSGVCAILYYLNRTNRLNLINLTSVNLVNSNQFLKYDAFASRNLEIFTNLKDGGKRNSLLSVLDNTVTSGGGRLLVWYLSFPLTKIDEIKERQAAILDFKQNQTKLEAIRNCLSEIKDISRISGKLVSNTITPRDLLTLAHSLKVLPKLKQLTSTSQSKLIQEATNNIQNFDNIAELISSAICDNPANTLSGGGYINANFNKQLAELNEISTNGKTLLVKMESYLKEQTGIKNLKIGFTSIFGYYIEIRDKDKSLVPYNFKFKQSVSGGEKERYVTDELIELQNRILTASEDAIKLENIIFEEVKAKLCSYVAGFKQAYASVSVIDVIAGLSLLALKNNYVCPELNEVNKIEIKEGRHPVLETILKHGEFTPNNVKLNTATDKIMLITGPNMGGKSTYMRMCALIVLMTQIGSFIPADSANISICDQLFTRIGASDDLASGQSTFMVEMVEVANILANASSDSLIILDEVGRGTSTFDGLSLAYAIIEHISKKLKAKTMFATHYHELTSLEGVLEGLKNYSVSIKEINNTIIFVHKILRGGTDKSFGIEVAKLAGIPKSVINTAKQFLVNLENSSAKIELHKNMQDTVPNQEAIAIKNKQRLDDIISILSEVNVNNLSPLSAFETMVRLKEKLGE